MVYCESSIQRDASGEKKHLFHIWKPTGIQTNNMSCEGFFIYIWPFCCVLQYLYPVHAVKFHFQQTFDLKCGNKKTEKRLPLWLLPGNRYSWAFTLFHTDEQTHTLLHIIPINYIQSKFNEKMNANVNPLLVPSESLCNDDNDQPFSFSLTHTHTLAQTHCAANQPSEANVGGNVLLISSTLNP